MKNDFERLKELCRQAHCLLLYATPVEPGTEWPLDLNDWQVEYNLLMMHLGHDEEPIRGEV